ncbi:putative AMS1-alpha-mannosidase [Ceraceosorus guamensis]|uniref:alpha-mannosidase n=1 Tax=Ceraceosorus guamensis TaxID=1522189 RepID=A0A316W2F4_9BASI|nr:putative AMS1-alpha-mannosidase [Ceraceosorus guamensis]PWN42751.1 putative AMS1-alpha-mannosidase [Ceraceosorus guamensis]
MSGASQGPRPYPELSIASERPVHGIDIRSVQERRLEEFHGGQYSRWNLASVLFESSRDDEGVIRIWRWDPKPGDKPSFDEAIKQTFRPSSTHENFSPSWSNHWLRLEIQVPKQWQKKEWVELQLDPGCEAMIFSSDGMSLQGITGSYGADRRVDFPLTPEMREGTLELYVEVSCNGMFGVPNGQEGDPDPNRTFSFDSCAIVVKRPQAWKLLWDFEMLEGCVKNMPRDGPLQNKALWAANKIQDTFRRDDLSTIDACRKIAQEVLGKDWEDLEEGLYDVGNRKDREDVALWAIGHTHIDTAWLWPYSATQQKVARSWSTQIALMERYPEYRFTASTAQQYIWLEQLYPKLFARLIKAAKRGTFQPIGATWVECDGNLPSGESFARQFLYGQRYFESRFGKRCNVFWLPDSFGYNAQLPQIARSSGCDYFFTQKLSWSNVNRFPHNTMMWVGLDGTQIITHLTPVNNYDSMCGVDDLVRGVKNNQNLNVQPTALLLFGFGDGGGGPTTPHLERLRRARATWNNGHTEMPKVGVGRSVQDFFKNVLDITEGGDRLPRWVGDVYLEFHRGVQTSHGSIKKHNRQLESAMQRLEWLATHASLLGLQHGSATGNYKYPKDEIDSIWEPLLTNQFHDVLPGSSIRLVYDDAERIYADLHKRVAKATAEAEKVLKGLAALEDGTGFAKAYNTLSIPRKHLVRADPSWESAERDGTNSDGSEYVFLEDKQGSNIVEERTAVVAAREAVYGKEHYNSNFTLRNANVSLTVASGFITSIRTLQKRTWVELIPPGRRAGLTIAEDYPPQFDAWETEVYSLNTAEDIPFHEVRISEVGPFRAALRLQAQWGQSSAVVKISLDAIGTSIASCQHSTSGLHFHVEIDWQEKHRFLRFELPTILNADNASFETPFGVTKRPTTRNTTWEAAKFEVASHKFFDLSESSFGVSILNDCKYGASVEGGRMRLSLLKAPTYPDAHTDEGKHSLNFVILPHSGPLSMLTVNAARELNSPLTRAATTRPSKAFSSPFRLHQDVESSIVLDTIKRGEADFDYHGKTGSGTSVILRFYEALGAHAGASLDIVGLNVQSVVLANLLEDTIGKASDYHVDLTTPADEEHTRVRLHLRPFQVITLKVQLAA